MDKISNRNYNLFMEVPPINKERKEEIPFRISFTINELVSEDMVGPDGKVEPAGFIYFFEKGERALRNYLELDRERLKTDDLLLEYDAPEVRFIKQLSLFDEIKIAMDAYVVDDNIIFSGKILRKDGLIAEYKKATTLVSTVTKSKVALPDRIKTIFDVQS